MSALQGYSNQSGRNDGIAVPHTYSTPPFEILGADFSPNWGSQSKISLKITRYDSSEYPFWFTTFFYKNLKNEL